MEDKKKLSRWLLDNSKDLHLRATQWKWVEEWIPQFYDFEVTIVIDGQTVKGRGIDINSDLAFTKAGAEAIERAICRENHLATHGVAVHTEYKLASINARNELVERDRFFCHYLTRTAFQKKTIETTHTPADGSMSKGVSIDFESIQEKLETHGVEIYVFNMAPLNSIQSVICISQGEGVGLTIGLGASENPHVATQKALTECLMNTIANLHKKPPPLNISSILAPPATWPVNHRRLYWQQKEMLSENHWILDGDSVFDNHESVELDSFQYTELKSENRLLQEAPITAIRCLNSHLQKSLDGVFKPHHVNMKRLRQFSGKHIRISEINQLAHPLG